MRRVTWAGDVGDDAAEVVAMMRRRTWAGDAGEDAADDSEQAAHLAADDSDVSDSKAEAAAAAVVRAEGLDDVVVCVARMSAHLGDAATQARACEELTNLTGFNPVMQTRAGAAGAVEAVQAAGAFTRPLLSSTW